MTVRGRKLPSRCWDSRPVRLATSLLFGVCLCGVRLSVEAEEKDAYAEILLQYKIQPNVEGLRLYLKGLVDPAEAKLVEALLKQLGDDDYSKREAATRELSRMHSPPVGQLRVASDSPDLEVRYRARAILEEIEAKSRQLHQILHAAMETIGRKDLAGLAAEVISVIPLCDKNHVTTAAQNALQATSRPEDVEILRQAVGHESRVVRAAAVASLGEVLGEGATEELRGHLEAKDPPVKLAAAHALANLGDRKCLPKLGELLGEDDLDIRWKALRVLWALTGQRFRYVPYDSEQNRAGPAKAWREWIAAKGQTAELHFPLDMTQVEMGRTLICIQNQNRVIELDQKGEQVWEVKNVNRPWACEGLPNGHRLVSSYNGRSVIEYGVDGKQVWQKTGLPGGPSSVQRLPNGNTLVACTDSHLVLEVQPDGKIGWQAKVVNGRPFHARRLENGNTLVTLHRGRKVVELNREGKEVWALTGFRDPQSAHRLPNGNTLVADYSQRKLLEYDHSRKLIWSKQLNVNAYDADRLPNGNVLLGTTQGIQELSPAGDVIWEKKLTAVSRVCRY